MDGEQRQCPGGPGSFLLSASSVTLPLQNGAILVMAHLACQANLDNASQILLTHNPLLIPNALQEFSFYSLLSDK